MTVGLKTPSGLDFDDIFAVTGEGDQTTNILIYNGMDIGNRYAPGTTNIADTGFRKNDGVDVKNIFGGKGVGLWRPSGGAWNAGLACSDSSEKGTIDFWTSYIESWIDFPQNATCVNNVMNDCIYRDVDSDAPAPTCAIWAYNPFEQGDFKFSYKRLWSGNNDGDPIYTWPFTVGPYCKGLAISCHSGAGDWAGVLVSCEVTVADYGTYTYEGYYRANTDSNHPWTGSSWSITHNGKNYVFYGS